MLTYCLRRALLGLLLVLVVASAAFVLTRLAPGDSSLELANLTAQERAVLRHRLGLDQPLPVQYAAWLTRVLRFDFGESIHYSRPVRDLLGERARNTAVLALAALVLATLIGIPLGVYTGTHTTGIGPAVARVLSVLLLSTPPLIGSLLLVFLAARTGWLPVGGMTSAEGPGLWPSRLADVMAHLLVPALALALPLAATLERLQAQALAESSREPFIRATRARGVTARDALVRHAWPASLGPILGLYGLMIGSLFSGSFIVEVVTAWPGLGRLMVDGLLARDIYLVAGTAAAGAACLAAGTFLADAAHAWIDPRVRERL